MFDSDRFEFRTCRLAIFTAPALILALALALAVSSGPAHAADLEPGDPFLDFAPLQPQFEVRRVPSRQVPMRDGVRLSTDLYFPVGAPNRAPVILIRTPYDKSQLVGSRTVEMFASQGFVVAVQDHRGKYESEGEFFAYPDTDRQDGYDTVEWLVNQSWSSGKIGTYGCSYLGEVQYELAAMRHPNHIAAIPQSGASPYDQGHWWGFGFRSAGAFELAAALAWNRMAASKVHYGPPPHVDREAWFASEAAAYFSTRPNVPEIDLMAVLKSLPVVDMIDKAKSPPTEFANWVSHERDDPYWDRQGRVTEDDRFDLPALHVNSWYDPLTRGSFDMVDLFKRHSLSARSRNNQVLIMLPTSHCRSESATAQIIVGERNMGDARLAYERIYLSWFRHWLMGGQFSENDIQVEALPPFILYVMGKNRWRTAHSWPIEGTSFRTYYFDSGGKANSRYGDGVLTESVPGDSPPDHYSYDPEVPTPARGGSICCTGGAVPEGAVDQRPLEVRSDLLAYTTAPLKSGLEVTGPIHARLYVSSDAPDTDFVVKLTDVAPDGTSYIIQEGIMRARYRQGYDSQVMMADGELYEIEVDLQATSNWFAPGHRIRVLVASANFPRWDRNLNTGGKNWDESEGIVANNTIHHSAQYPSHIVLPVLPE